MSLLEPEGLWDRVRRRCERDTALLPLLLIPLAGALGVAVAAEAGVRLFNTEWNPVLGYSARPDNEGSRVGLLWLALALAPFVQAVVGTLVLPLYGRPRRWRTALVVFVVGAVPLYVADCHCCCCPASCWFSSRSSSASPGGRRARVNCSRCRAAKVRNS